MPKATHPYVACLVLVLLTACARPSLAGSGDPQTCREIQNRNAPPFNVYGSDEMPSGLISQGEAAEIARAQPESIDAYCVFLGEEAVDPGHAVYLVVVDLNRKTVLHGPRCEDPPCPSSEVTVTWGVYMDAKSGEVVAESSL